MCLFPKHAYTLLAESVSVRVHVQTCLPRVVHQTCNSTHVPAYVVASSCSFRGSTACEVRIQIPDNQTQKLSVSLFGLGLASSSPNFDKSNDADGVQGSTKVLVRIESVGSSERVCTAADEPGGWVRQKVAAVWGMKGSVWGPPLPSSAPVRGRICYRLCLHRVFVRFPPLRPLPFLLMHFQFYLQ